MDLITSDGGLAIFTAVGIVVTAFSIVRDAKAQKAQMMTEDVRTNLPNAA